MVWCSQCQAEVELEADEANGFSCCVQCGRVLEDTAFSTDVMFTKGADGAGELVGQLVGANGDAHGVSRYSGGRLWASGGGHEGALSRGRHEIVALVEALRISPSSEAIEAGHRLYRLALQRGFTRGRRVNQVAAVCLYIFCRLERRPYMLIDFSDHLSVNVYGLGAVFLDMLRLLRLEEHATFTKPIDPSLFMNRFVDRLRLPTQELRTKVGYTATRLVQSMKRDWMLTGRRPNGICGAALFLAAHIHGVEKTKMDIIAIVHVGWGTVERRVMELAETGGAELTLKEIEERDKASDLEREKMLLEYERAAIEDAPNRQRQLTWPASSSDATVASGSAEGDGSAPVVMMQPDATGRCCEHVRAGSPLLAHGMCRECLQEYLQVTMTVQEKGFWALINASLLRPVRHLENEAAIEEFEATEAEAPGCYLGHVLAAGFSSKAKNEEAPGTSILATEEDEFDEALHSSDLQPLAKALGGVAAVVAMAPIQPRKRRVPLEESAQEANGRDADGVSNADMVVKSERDGLVMQQMAGDPDRGARQDEPSPSTGTIDMMATAPRHGGMHSTVTAAADDSLLAASGKYHVQDAAVAAGRDVVDKGGDGHSSDHLSDIHDDEVDGYLATNEEASVRRQLWLEMNRDWVELQEAKKAAEAAEDKRAGLARPKRKYLRKKAEVPAAEDAAGATRNLLASKKLSNKINYGALADLFGSCTSVPGDDAAWRPDNTIRSMSPRETCTLEDDAAPSAAYSLAGFGADAMQSRVARKPAGGSAVSLGADGKCTPDLEDNKCRLDGLGGRGFIGSLTFMREAGRMKGADARARLQSLSLKRHVQ
uniref:BFR1m n=1 Tax=Volvox carteri f. nagariensis TaxID=3068 RepID=D9CJ93_VOLCA|nr:BFR1m [Volvox carteri f. nagariensis]